MFVVTNICLWYKNILLYLVFVVTKVFLVAALANDSTSAFWTLCEGLTKSQVKMKVLLALK